MNEFKLPKQQLQQQKINDHKDGGKILSGKNVSSTSASWDDSGVCITGDSGLNIDSGMNIEDVKEHHQQLEEQEEEKQQQQIEAKEEDKKDVKFDTYNTLVNAFQQDQDGDTVLHLAIIKGLVDVAFALIRVVPHPDYLDLYNHLLQTPLHLATLTRQPNIIRRLVVAGATLDLRDRHGNTALHIACQQGDLESVKALISPIQDKEIKEIDSIQMHYSINGIQRVPMDFLQLKNYEGETCIHLAAYNESINIIDYLVLYGADINAKEGKSGKSALHWAVETQRTEFVQFLLKRCRANVNIGSYAGHTPLHLAWNLLTIDPNSNKIRGLIKLLRDFGGQPSMPPMDSDFDDNEDDESEDDIFEEES